MFGGPVAYRPKPPQGERFHGNRQIRGSRVNDMAMVAKEPGDDWKARRMLADQRQVEIDASKTDPFAEEEKSIIKDAFHEQAYGKWVAGEFRRAIDCGLKAFEADLFVRREKLRSLILQEDYNTMSELVKLSQGKEQQRRDEYQRQAEEFRALREAQHKELVAEKRLMQYRERCDVARQLVVHRNLINSKEAQRYQIMEKKWLKELEKNEEVAWLEVIKKNIAAIEEREREEVRRRKERNLEVAKVLLLQKEAVRKQAEIEDTLFREQLRQFQERETEIKEEKRQELLNRHKRQKELLEQLQEQMRYNEEVRTRQQQQDKAWDDMMVKLVKEEIRREEEQGKRSNEALRRETYLYLENLKQLREVQAEITRQCDLAIAKEVEEMRKRKEEKCGNMKAVKKKLLEDTLRERAQQVALQEEQRRQEEEMKIAERELTNQMWEQRQRLADLHREHSRSDRRNYNELLKGQIKYNELLKEREREEEERRARRQDEEEERYQLLIKQLLAIPVSAKPHSFYAVLKNEASSPSAPEVAQRSIRRMAYPCPEMKGTDPVVLDAMYSPDGGLPKPKPTDDKFIEKLQSYPIPEPLTSSYNGLGDQRVPPQPPLAFNIHKPKAVECAIRLPCPPCAPDQNKTCPIQSNVPCYMKHL